MERIHGRKEEIALLHQLRKSYKSEFVAVYGRRRVGKTFLIREAFDGNFSFQLSGVANVGMKQHLQNFHTAFLRYNFVNPPSTPPTDWFEAFNRLSLALEGTAAEKKIIFLDELPWLGTPQSNFIPALEYFWNSWASARRDVLLIVCGSAASWIINQLINNRGGLHNRVTERIYLKPFTLFETETFLKARGAIYDRYQLLELYMVMGGIPFYLESIQTNRSVAQNIDRLFFAEGGLLSGEYINLYRSLFRKYEKHTTIVEVLSKKAAGMTRNEIIRASQLPNGGSTTQILEELEHSGFIRRYYAFGKGKRDGIYQLIDPFTLFYLSFVKDSKAQSAGTWLAQLDSPKWQAWSGYAFESICWYHIDFIKKHLGIAAVYTEISTWRSQKSQPGAQIDIVIDRKDKVINLCEIKFTTKAFTISKAYADNLQNKLMAFRVETNTRKTLFTTMIAANGLSDNAYARQIVQDVLDINALFD
ncbi:MAG TPA: hypothetical protein PKA00_07500 [Saprospiraceae bacterium]|nr:hypothetical protein [Saprospiraceae bacterium]HMQ82736.1 hypothetical protein [Saprospiraceae bacterium]